MIFNQTAKTFTDGTAAQCGTFITEHITGATAVLHVFASDAPSEDDTCQCGAYFYCAAVAETSK